MGEEMKRGTHMTNEARANMRLAHVGNLNYLGRKPSIKTKTKIRKSLIDYFSQHPEAREKLKLAKMGTKHTPEARAKMSRDRMGNKFSLGYSPTRATREKMSLALRGRIFTKEHRRKISRSLLGEKSYQWKGGVTLKYRGLKKVIRDSFEYRQWRSDIFHRDHFTCVSCGIRRGRLQAHHIKPFLTIIEEYGIKTLADALTCEELWGLNNGVTLCEICHRKERKNG
jgi:hypothetical protein